MQDVALEIVRFISGPNDLVAFLEAVRPVDRSEVLDSLRALMLAIPSERLWPEPMLDYASDALLGVFERTLPAFYALRIGSDVAFLRPPLLRLPPSTAVILTNASVFSEEIGDVFTPWPTNLVEMSLFLACDVADKASLCRAWRDCCQLQRVDVQFESLIQTQLDAFMDVARTSWPCLQHFCLSVEKDGSNASAEFESSDSVCAWVMHTSATSLGLSEMSFPGATGIALSQTLFDTKTALTSLVLEHVDGLEPPSSLSSNLKSLVLHSLELTPS
ncbi:hypothetical protein SDRG_13688 [Saprolegnia diclina VS20]|uniref:F-box domain-containing protein n=1 Tax=Saprolegnia diclina (strain VS20) TaxID=1156394 RepID=T0PSX8_SAPDV|nr:hypothetical protein SDRG_13688 [Saprolegnia diclina VS20]EQC28609.1 hypothetical protein SDRG_13688 [Saprolegnia diclina VS20]|eukprot:XP_008618006.1 hypothetical protein SDRG_13688 [Saprolegnia diclina VS20]